MKRLMPLMIAIAALSSSACGSHNVWWFCDCPQAGLPVCADLTPTVCASNDDNGKQQATNAAQSECPSGCGSCSCSTSINGSPVTDCSELEPIPNRGDGGPGTCQGTTGGSSGSSGSTGGSSGGSTGA